MIMMQIFGKDFKVLFQVSAAIDQVFIKQELFKKVYLLKYSPDCTCQLALFCHIWPSL